MTELERELAALHGRDAHPQPVAEPLAARVLDRLTEVLVLTDELLDEFQTEDANSLLWVETYVRRAYEEIACAVKRLAQ